jgi:predicted DCC family thiol-disulfide oxidoreductase YuxK/DNA-binding CsgD family transcriptional regulator
MTQKNIEELVNAILGTIEREREREIVSRRYGLFDRKETLEQIGELLGITRERVRQLEKSVMSRLRASAEAGDLPGLSDFEGTLTEKLTELGSVARVANLSGELTGESSTKIDHSRLAFVAELCPNLTVVADNDNYYQSAAITEVHDSAKVQKLVSEIIEAIKKIGKPTDIKEVAKQVGDDDPKHVEALASVSKLLATLHGKWGLIKWPTVNPKNIRDKIYVILQQNGKHMHFNEIAAAIKDSDFKRKDVTTQAIHNELIKDKRFVLIGRGIYALREWGYKKGTVADIITEVLKDAGEPLHRDEIVKRVLKSRYVKETTILLNLQGKNQFQRVAKATYTLAG